MTVLGYPAHHSSAHLHPVKPYDPRFFEAFAHVDQPLGQVIELVIVFGRRKGQQLPQELGKPVCRIGQFTPPDSSIAVTPSKRDCLSLSGRMPSTW